MDQVQIIEVGPRDGLQNEKTPVPTPVKADFIHNLAHAGLIEIEVTSFVSPKWVPQLADSSEIFNYLQDLKNLKLSALVPNQRGLQNALQTPVQRMGRRVTNTRQKVVRNPERISHRCSGLENIVRSLA